MTALAVRAVASLLLSIPVGALAAPGAAPSAAGPASALAPPTQPPTAPPKPATGPPPEVDLKCAPEPVRVGEPLVCTLTAVHPESVSITVPLPAGASEVVSAATETPEASPAATEKRPDGKLQTTRRFQLVAQEPKASLKLPGVRIIYTEASGGEGKVELPPRKVAITRLLEGAQDPQFRTFKTPQPAAAASAPASAAGATDPAAPAFLAAHGPVPFVTTNWPALIAVIVLGGGLVGGLLGMAIMRFLANRRRVEVPWVDPRPAHVIALAALDALHGEQLPAQGRMKEFYFKLSEIVRAYLEKRFEFNALEMTSDEIRAAFRAIERDRLTAELGKRGLSETEFKILLPERMSQSPALIAVEDFLIETDWVKFADFAPSESGADTVMRAARGIVELTRAAEATAGGQTPTDAPAPTAGKTGGAA